jgi:hypothetical protein
LAHQRVPVGSFEVEATLPASSERATLVELAVGSTYVASLHGGHDDRALGLFFSSICLR